MTANETPQATIYDLDGRPPLRAAIPLGLQHVFAMFIGNLAPIFVVAGVVSTITGEVIVTPAQRMLMIQAVLIASGLSTLIQLYPIRLGKKVQIGAGLPIVMGTSFAFVPTMISIGVDFGINAIIGAVIVGSLMEVVMGLFIKQVRKLIAPIVVGSVLISIGLSLLPVGVTYFAGGAGAQNAHITMHALLARGEVVPENMANLAVNFASWQNLLLGTVVFLVIVTLQRLAKGLMKVSAIFIGIVVGYILAIILGVVDFNAVANANVIALPRPLSIMPEFYLGPILAMSIMCMVSGVETMGHINGVTMAVWNKPADDKQLQGSLLADAAGNLIASFFGSLPNTSFGQNVGIVSMTKAVNKFCIFITAAVLILAGFSPKISSVLSVMPNSVLGGAVITVIAMIMLNGIKIVAGEGFSERNVFIFVLTFGVGYAAANNSHLVDALPGPLSFLFGNTTIAVCIIAIILNQIFPKPKEIDI